MKTKSNAVSRRDFVKSSAFLATTPLFSNFSILRNFQSEKVRLACIGIGNQGANDIMAMHKTGLADFVAFCDVDMGASQTLQDRKSVV